jgi:hypothetical protein
MMQQPYGYGPPSMRQEVGLLAEYGVQVTTARFVVGSQLYPIAGLTKVDTFFIPAQRGNPILGAVFFGLVALGCLPGHAFVAALIFLALCGICIAVARSKRPMYGIIIWTAGTNVRAILSFDQGHVMRVLQALHHAIGSR